MQRKANFFSRNLQEQIYLFTYYLKGLIVQLCA